MNSVYRHYSKIATDLILKNEYNIVNIMWCVIENLHLLIPVCAIIVVDELNKHIVLVLGCYTLFLKQVYLDYYIN